MKNRTFIVSLVAALALVSESAFAGHCPPPDIPIDGGLSWLLVAGGAFGIKKIRDARLKA